MANRGLRSERAKREPQLAIYPPWRVGGPVGYLLQTPDYGLLPAVAGRTDPLTSAPGGGILTTDGKGAGNTGGCQNAPRKAP